MSPGGPCSYTHPPPPLAHSALSAEEMWHKNDSDKLEPTCPLQRLSTPLSLVSCHVLTSPLSSVTVVLCSDMLQSPTRGCPFPSCFLSSPSSACSPSHSHVPTSGVEGIWTDMDRFPFLVSPWFTMDTECILMILKGKHACAQADCCRPKFSPLKPLCSIFYSFPSLIQQW